MKILLAHFQIQDYGGIVNYSEFLARGFKKLGHTVSSLMLKNKGKSGVPKTKDRELEEGWEYGEGLDLWMHQKKGWEGMNQLNYVTDINTWYHHYCDGYDLIIYIVPVPTKSKDTAKDTAWMKLFEGGMAHQIAVVHDGNMQKLYPHIYSICEKLDGIICVHDAAFNSCSVLPVRRAFIPNAHDVSNLCKTKPENRINGFVSLQTFKRWKRVDDLIRAIPHMSLDTKSTICGGGIEYHYMTSKTKVKPEYLDELGTPIWDNALDHGMKFLGYVTTSERDKLLSNNRLLIDPSWSKNYSELGSHFNRVMLEAMVKGCIPVCTDLGMKNSLLFKKNINYIEVPYDCPPQHYANIIDEALSDTGKLARMQQANFKLLEAFDMSNIAGAIIEFSFDRKAGITGKPTEQFLKAVAKNMEHFDEFFNL